MSAEPTPPAGAPKPPAPCPICGKPSVAAHRPFCSPRCRQVDLHHWLTGRYAVPVVEEDGGSDEA
jgi:endogenous inhibitor of DNA gyrase (YacG/DUF329 family)